MMFPFLLLQAASAATPQTLTIPAFATAKGDVKVSLAASGLDTSTQVACEIRSVSDPSFVVPLSTTPTSSGFTLTFPAVLAGQWMGACQASLAVAGAALPAVKVTPTAFGSDYDTIKAHPLQVPKSTNRNRAGLDTAAPQIVTDTLHLLAEIAFEKAKSRSYAILGDQVTMLVCERASLATPIVVAYNPGQVKGKQLVSLTIPAGKLLPATCSTVASLDSFVAWANSAPTIAKAVQSDALTAAGSVLAHIASDAMSEWQKAQVSFLIGAVHATLQDNVLNGTQPGATDAQSLLYALSLHSWMAKAGSSEPALNWSGEPWSGDNTKFHEVESLLAFGIQRSFAVASQCQEGGCTTQDVLRRLSDVTGAPTGWDNVWTEIAPLATSLYTLTQTDGAKDPTRAATVAVLDILDLVLHAAAKADPVGASGIVDVLTQTRPLVLGILDEDITGAVSAGITIVERGLQLELKTKNPSKEGIAALQALGRITPVVSAVASNAANLKQANGADEESQARLEAARKATLQALVDASARRDGRWGDAIVSVGANVGLAPFAWSATPTTALDDGMKYVGIANASGDTLAGLPVTLPMGIGLDVFPGRKDKKFGVGFHGQLSLVDLAQFLPDSGTSGDATTDIEWSDFVMIGLQAGFAIGRPQDPLNITVDGRWAPYEQAGPYRVAVQVSYYVPFFDFN
jgi:hypothetical protein